MMGLERRALDATEFMDDPSCDPDRLARTYRHFGVINRVVGRWHTIYRTHIRPALDPDGGNTLLDIGFGGGDITRRVASWAARDGIALSVTAIDPDPRAYSFATATTNATTTAPGGVLFRETTSSALVEEGHRFDVVISNHVLHHLDDGLGDFLDDSLRLASRLVVHSDIERSPVAYVAYSVVALPFAVRSFAHADGRTSIRRSYRHDEILAAIPEPWRVQRTRPSRLLLTATIDGRS